MYDVVVRGGRVIDPAQNLDATLDVAISGDTIAAVGPNLASGGVRQIIDADGLIVTPGLIDLHTHVFWGVPPLGVEPDPHCLAHGVTTAVDAGSAGASTFPAFRRYIIDVAATRIVAMLHIASIGMARDDGAPGEAVGELEDIRWANVERAVAVARAHADCIVGIKVRLGEGQVGNDPERCREALRRACQAAAAIGKPTMIHIGRTPIPLDEILAGLDRGDIITHCYHGHPEGILDGQGRVKATVRQAAERGVHFDVGHGAGSFAYSVARPALDQGFLPGTISSDIHAWSVAGPAYDLATTASKFLHLGVPLPEVIRRMTVNPAQALPLDLRIGTLAPGAAADVSLLRLTDGEWPLRDAMGQVETAGQRLEPVAVLRAGRLRPCAPSVYAPHAHGH